MGTERQKSFAAVGVTLAVAVLLVTPLAVYVLLRTQAGGPGLRQLPSSVEETAAQQKSELKHPFPAFEPADNEIRAPRPRASLMPPAPTPQPLRLPAPAKPLPADFAPGMEKSSLLARFGRPNMVTTEVSGGQTIETFHYLRPEVFTETIVMLRSGRVIGATSAAY